MAHTAIQNNASDNKADNKMVLACIDGSNVTESVCDYAAWYARKLNVPVTLLHVIDIPKSRRHDLSGAIGMDSRRNLLEELTLLDEHTAKIALKHGEALMKDAKTHIIESFDKYRIADSNLNNEHHNSNNPQGNEIEIKIHQRHGKLLPAIEHFAKDTMVIVLGRRGEDHQNQHDDAQVNLGSQIETIVRAMHQPILVCSDDFSPPDSYMLAFDGSPTAIKAVDMICESDLSQSSQGHLVMVDNQNSARENSLANAHKKLTDAGLDISIHHLDSSPHDGDVVKTLTHFQAKNNISMIIIGAYGNAKWKRFFVGSTTTKLLANTKVPVLLLR